MIENKLREREREREREKERERWPVERGMVRIFSDS